MLHLHEKDATMHHCSVVCSSTPTMGLITPNKGSHTVDTLCPSCKLKLMHKRIVLTKHMFLTRNRSPPLCCAICSTLEALATLCFDMSNTLKALLVFPLAFGLALLCLRQRLAVRGNVAKDATLVARQPLALVLAFA